MFAGMTGLFFRTIGLEGILAMAGNVVGAVIVGLEPNNTARGLYIFLSKKLLKAL